MPYVATCVGLGNVWRYPFVAFHNGGGAFFIPYLLVILLVGQPLYFMEMCLGQFASRGNVQMFAALKPALIGIGYGQLIGASFVATYYCALMAIAFFYLAHSLDEILPWSKCVPEWKLANNMTCVDSNMKKNASKVQGISSSELWFTREVLREKTNIDDGIGFPDWRLTICLLLAWIATYIITVKGFRSSGRINYILAIFPYVLLICLLFRAATLQGSVDGIIHFYKPDWSKLADTQVWYFAVTQCFFSLNVGFGSIIMYSSFNSFRHNIQRDVLIATCVDTCTSLLAGTTIFAFLGNLSYELNVDLKEVISTGGTAVAFISYPGAIAKFDNVPWLLSTLFFLMFLVLSIGSMTALQGESTTTIMEAFPAMKSWQASGITSSIGFLIGLIYVTPGGQVMLNLIDHFAGTFLIIIVIMEVSLVSWWYGLTNFCIDIEFMLKKKISCYWRFMWGIGTPITLITIFVFFLMHLETLRYGSYEIVDWALNCGWAILAFGVFQIFICIVYCIIVRRQFGCKGMFVKSFSSENWMPLNPEISDYFKKYKKQKIKAIADSGYNCITAFGGTLSGKI